MKETILKKIAYNIPKPILKWCIVRVVSIAKEKNPGIHVEDLGYSKLWKAINEK